MKQRTTTKGIQPRFLTYVLIWHREGKKKGGGVQSACRMYIKPTLKMHSNIRQVQTGAV